MTLLRRTRVLASFVVALGLGACGDDSGSGGSGADGAGAQGQGAEGVGAQGQGAQGVGGDGVGGAPPPPTATCPAPVEAADASAPTAVVGDGSAASCTEAALDAALAAGGIVTFDCGADAVTITVTSPKAITVDTVLDGGGLVTLDGGDATRILHLASAWDQVSPHLTVQRLAFENGFTSDEPNTSETDQGGAAIFREGGSLDVIDCQFSNNTCATSGQDVSGGAITSQGIGDTRITGSVFFHNTGSNGGAVGNLGNGLAVANSTFDDNAATGTDGNPGNGGNGGAIVFDGADTEMSICGSTFTNNTAGAQGGAVFRVAYSDEPTIIDRCSFEQNAADPAVGLAGALYLENTTISMTASTLSANSAHYGGGIWIGSQAVADISNVTITDNVADQGGGIWFAGSVTGSITNATIAKNRIQPKGYANGVFGDGSGVEFINCIILDNGCEDGPVGSGGPNLEFPDNGGSVCVTSATIVDPLLGALADNGGPTMTMAPGAGSPAIGMGQGCPATDQRGEPRPADGCTLGAVELAP